MAKQLLDDALLGDIDAVLGASPPAPRRKAEPRSEPQGGGLLPPTLLREINAVLSSAPRDEPTTTVAPERFPTTSFIDATISTVDPMAKDEGTVLPFIQARRPIIAHAKQNVRALSVAGLAAVPHSGMSPHSPEALKRARDILVWYSLLYPGRPLEAEGTSAIQFPSRWKDDRDMERMTLSESLHADPSREYVSPEELIRARIDLLRAARKIGYTDLPADTSYEDAQAIRYAVSPEMARKIEKQHRGGSLAGVLAGGFMKSLRAVYRFSQSVGDPLGDTMDRLGLGKDASSSAEMIDWIDDVVQRHGSDWQPGQLESWTELFTNPGKLLQQIVAAAPYMGTLALAGAAGGPAAAIYTAFETEGRQAYDEAKASGASEDEAQWASMIIGGLNAGIEYLQVAQIMRFANPKVAASFSQALRGRVLSRMLAKGLTGLALQEGLEEVLQQLVSEYGANLVYDKKIEPGQMNRLLSSFVVGSAAGLAFAGTGRAVLGEKHSFASSVKGLLDKLDALGSDTSHLRMGARSKQRGALDLPTGERGGEAGRAQPKAEPSRRGPKPSDAGPTITEKERTALNRRMQQVARGAREGYQAASKALASAHSGLTELVHRYFPASKHEALTRQIAKARTEAELRNVAKKIERQIAEQPAGTDTVTKKIGDLIRIRMKAMEKGFTQGGRAERTQSGELRKQLSADIHAEVKAGLPRAEGLTMLAWVKNVRTDKLLAVARARLAEVKQAARRRTAIAELKKVKKRAGEAEAKGLPAALRAAIFGDAKTGATGLLQDVETGNITEKTKNAFAATVQHAELNPELLDPHSGEYSAGFESAFRAAEDALRAARPGKPGQPNAMSTEQIEAITQGVQAVLHQAKTKNRLRVGQKNRATDEVAKQVVEQSQLGVSARYGEESVGAKRGPGFVRKIAGRKSRTPHSNAKQLAAQDETGVLDDVVFWQPFYAHATERLPLQRDLWNWVREQYRSKLGREPSAKELVQASEYLWNDAGRPKHLFTRRPKVKTRTVETPGLREIDREHPEREPTSVTPSLDLTSGQVAIILASWEDSDLRQRMVKYGGGFGRAVYRWSPETIEAVRAQATDFEKATADILVRLGKRTRAPINHYWRLAEGYDLITGDDVYVPSHADRRMQEGRLPSGYRTMQGVMQRGRYNRRVHHTHPLRLTDAFHEIQQSIQDTGALAVGPAHRNAMRLLAQPAVREMIDTRQGDGALAEYMAMFEDAEGVRPGRSPFLASAYHEAMRRVFYPSVFVANPTILLFQTVSLMNVAMAEGVNLKDVIDLPVRSVGAVVDGLAPLTDELMSRSAFFEDRWYKHSLELLTPTTGKHIAGGWQSSKNPRFWTVSYWDKTAIEGVAALAEKNLRRGDKAFDRTTAEGFKAWEREVLRLMVDGKQPMFDAYNTTPLQREAKTDVGAAVLTFVSRARSALAQGLHDTIGFARIASNKKLSPERRRAAALKAVRNMIVIGANVATIEALRNLGTGLIYRRRAEDERDRRKLLSGGQRLTEDIADYAAGLINSTFPYFGLAVHPTKEAVVHKATGRRKWEREVTPLLDLLNRSFRAVGDAGPLAEGAQKAIKGDDDVDMDALESRAQNALTVIGAVAGKPFVNLWKMYRGLAGALRGEHPRRDELRATRLWELATPQPEQKKNARGERTETDQAFRLRQQKWQARQSKLEHYFDDMAESLTEDEARRLLRIEARRKRSRPGGDAYNRRVERFKLIFPRR